MARTSGPGRLLYNGAGVRYPFFCSLVFLATSCATSSSVQIKDAKALPEDAEVRIVYAQPTQKFEILCKIEVVGNNTFARYREKEDFSDLMKNEARKCGANGVLFEHFWGFDKGSMTAVGKGIRILSEDPVAMKSDDIKALVIAIEGSDVELVKKILQPISRDRAKRSPKDDYLVDTSLYLATIQGSNCDKDIVTLLEKDYGGFVRGFRDPDLEGTHSRESNVPLCADVVSRSIRKMNDQPSALKIIHEFYERLIRTKSGIELNREAALYLKLLNEIADIIMSSCGHSSTDPLCAFRSWYLRTAETSSLSDSKAVRSNAQLLLSKLMKSS